MHITLFTSLLEFLPTFFPVTLSSLVHESKYIAFLYYGTRSLSLMLREEVCSVDISSLLYPVVLLQIAFCYGS